MTIDKFFTTWNGRFVDYDGKWGFQCVDLVRQYIKEVLGWAPYTALPTTGNAKDIFNKFPDGGNKYFLKIKNNPINMPQKGDIVFWGFPLGFYWDKGIPKWAGHTAIASVSWLTGLNVFGQNYGWPRFSRFSLHNYRGCLGWIRPKI